MRVDLLSQGKKPVAMVFSKIIISKCKAKQKYRNSSVCQDFGISIIALYQQVWNITRENERHICAELLLESERIISDL